MTLRIFFEKKFLPGKLFLCSEYFVRPIALVLGADSGIKSHFYENFVISFE